mmetsp:Transcript_25197/g.56698  ORF Transcript_25197/g.56698 Transcript_25197/m.56698 type:complete len:205 (+) Transcript_25197:690-1304(+)
MATPPTAAPPPLRRVRAGSPSFWRGWGSTGCSPTSGRASGPSPTAPPSAHFRAPPTGRLASPGCWSRCQRRGAPAPRRVAERRRAVRSPSHSTWSTRPSTSTGSAAAWASAHPRAQGRALRRAPERARVTRPGQGRAGSSSPSGSIWWRRDVGCKHTKSHKNQGPMENWGLSFLVGPVRLVSSRANGSYKATSRGHLPCRQAPR